MFGNFFNRKKEPAPVPEDWESVLVWLPAGDPNNPFPDEVLDCRPAASSLRATTKDRGAAERFNQLRKSDGSDSRGKLPDQAMVVDCELRFPFKGPLEDGPLFTAQEMEDKWDFYTFDSRLYIRRSWTGQLTHVAELESTPESTLVKRIHCEPNTGPHAREFAIAQLHFLVTAHLIQTPVPFPILPEVSRTATKAIAFIAFSYYGRKAQFGRYLKSEIKAAA